MGKSYIAIIVIVLMFFFTSCSTTTGLEHQDVIVGSDVISFNYKLYEMPSVGEWGYFDFTINLIDLKYAGDKAEIKFKSTTSIEVEEDLIEFEFKDKSENLRIKISPNNLNGPISLPFEGKIFNDNKEIPFSGSLLLNREQN